MSDDYRALIVDDNQLFAKALSRFLAKRGVVATAATGPEDAIAEAHVGRYDVVILDVDIDCPGGSISGFDLADTLHRRGLRVPLVFVSADTVSGDRQERALAHGAALLDKVEYPTIVEEAVALCIVHRAIKVCW